MTRTVRSPHISGMPERPGRMVPAAQRMLLLLAALCGAGCAWPGPAVGDEPLEIVRFRVPADRVVERFPAGTELRGFSVPAFEALVNSARAGAERESRQAPPRLLRTRHFARWDRTTGLLAGRSELVIEPSPAGPAEWILNPWTPAVELPIEVETGAAEVQVWTRADGRIALWVDRPETSAYWLHWNLQARPSSRGRGFTLGLPTTETSHLELDLPDGEVPDGPAGIRTGPGRSAEPGRSTWSFDGPGGAIDLRLRDRGEGRDPRRDAGIWVSGPTRIELLETAANWTMDWAVDAGPRGPRTFALELDAGLELIEVTGPSVEEYQAESRDSVTRVTVRLAPDAASPTAVSVRALARVPTAGSWTVPAARPLDALWTGGTTTVRLDASRTLLACRERSGRRITALPLELNDRSTLVFEAAAPQPVADLVFREPAADVSSEVRGRLLLGGSAPRLECQVTWRVHRGRLLALDLELPPAWLPDRLRIAGLDEPPDWHHAVAPDGSVHVHLIPPSDATDHRSLVLTLEATATVAGGPGAIDLPRIRPTATRLGDEVWIALSDAGLTLRPLTARGLAWVDPRVASGGSAGSEEPGPDGLKGSLAWRWIADDAAATILRERSGNEPSGAVDLRVLVDRTRIRYEWKIDVEAGQEPLATLAVGTSPGSVELEAWQFRDETTGIELERRPIDAARQDAFGLAGAGRACELVLPHRRRGQLTLRASFGEPWSGRGDVPLLVLPDRFHTRGTVLIEVERSVRSTVAMTGLRVLDPALAGPAAPGDEREGPAAAHFRRAHAFGYSAMGGRLELRTENLEPTRTTGVIRDAVLTTTFNPHGLSRHRLVLRIAGDHTARLDAALPTGAVLARAQRDGLTIVPTLEDNGTTLRIPLVTQSAARSFSTVTLEYLSSGGFAGGESALRPPLPAISLPCLSFCWEVLAPEPWGVSKVGTGLVATDPEPSLPSISSASAAAAAGAWLEPGLRAWRALFSVFRRTAAEPAEAGLLRALDEQVVATRPDEVTLGEWFTRWDSGPAPLVIDRMTLASAGWGPRSRVVPARFGKRPAGAARATLRPLGLTVIPLRGTLLITSLRGASDRPDGPLGEPSYRAAWEAAALQAAAWGCDRNDRFQSVSRWRGEATPRVSVRGEATESELPLGGWRSWQFTTPGWPAANASIDLFDAQRRAGWSWAVAAAVVLAGIAGRGQPARLRALVFSLLLAAGVLGLAVGSPRQAAFAAGATVGLAAVALIWLGQRLPARFGRRNRESRSTASPRSRLRGVATGLAVASATGLLAIEATRASAEKEGSRPIVALFPYEGLPEAGRGSERVVLSRQDAERLERLAAVVRNPAGRGVRALDATHRVTWSGEHSVVVSSTLLLDRGDAASSSWSVPVEDAREISATIDERAVPVQIQNDGRTALITLDTASAAAGQSRLLHLTLRRIVTQRRGSTEERIRLAINPVATARVEIGPAPGRAWIEVPSARGRIERGDDRGAGVAGLLGPAEWLEARWSASPDAPAEDSGGSVDGLVLWNAAAAGDHLQARFTLHKPGGTSILRLGLAPGLALRAGALAGLVDATWQGSEERPEWVARVDPPLPDGASIALEFWRPVSPSLGEGRALPRLEPLGVERYTGALGFRRPSDWSGRLTAGPAFEPLSDEAFVKLWGTLPEKPLTLAGAVRFSRTPAVAIATGPVPSQVVLDPEVQLSIEPGRIAVTLGASVAQVTGRCDQLELQLPPVLRVVSVEGDGLTDWSRPESGRLRLRFDGAPVARRSVRIQAWLPVPGDPLAPGIARYEVDVPWPRWLDVTQRPGTLTIVSPSWFQLAAAAGVHAVSTPAVAPAGAGPGAGAGAGQGTATGTATAANRAVYQVDRGEGPGRLTWENEPPRLGVVVQSQLTILPDFAEWVAVLRYDVSGGAADVVHLRLPTAWASGARVQMVGQSHQLTSEAQGAVTFWKIRPERPFWGSQRLIVRSSVPLPRTGAVAFPDLSPLGRWGTVDTFLALVDASGRPIVTEGSPGLQPIVDDTRFRAEEFAVPPGASTSVYHVRREGWSLRVHGPSERGPIGREDDSDTAHTTLADLNCTRRDDGSTIGQALYEVAPRSGPFLSLRPPAGAEPLWATVNNTPVSPLRARSGAWLFPLGDLEESGSPGTLPVRLIWKSPPIQTRGESLPPLRLPGLAEADVPSYISTFTPPSVDPRNPPGFEQIPHERLLISRVEWLGKAIMDSLVTIDRSSQRECEALVSSLVQFALRARDVERAALWNQTSPVEYRQIRIARMDERVRIARQALADALKNAGLEEFAESARIHVGLVPDDPESSTIEIPEGNPTVRIRSVGRPRTFAGVSDQDGPATVSVAAIAPGGVFDRPPGATLALLGLLAVSALVYFCLMAAERTSWLGPVMLALAVTGVALTAGPLPFAAALALGWLGWAARGT